MSLVGGVSLKESDTVLGSLVAMGRGEDTDLGDGGLVVVGHLFDTLELDHDLAWGEDRVGLGGKMQGLEDVELAVADDANVVVCLCGEADSGVST